MYTHISALEGLTPAKTSDESNVNQCLINAGTTLGQCLVFLLGRLYAIILQWGRSRLPYTLLLFSHCQKTLECLRRDHRGRF